jgi:hypothetical protein
LQKQSKALGMEVSQLTGIVGASFDTFEGAADKAGNVKCDTTSFSFDNLVDIVHLSTDKSLFSE